MLLISLLVTFFVSASAAEFFEGTICEPNRAPMPYHDDISLLYCDQPKGWKWAGVWKRAECPKSMVFSAAHKKCVQRRFAKKRQYYNCLPCWSTDNFFGGFQNTHLGYSPNFGWTFQPFQLPVMQNPWQQPPPVWQGNPPPNAAWNFYEPNQVTQIKAPEAIYINDRTDSSPEENTVKTAKETRLNVIERELLDAQQELDLEELRLYRPKPCPGAPPPKRGARPGQICSWMTDPLIADSERPDNFLECHPTNSGLSCGVWKSIPCAEGTTFEQSVQLCLPKNYRDDSAVEVPPKIQVVPTVEPVPASTVIVNPKPVGICGEGHYLIGLCNINFECPVGSFCDRLHNICCMRQ